MSASYLSASGSGLAEEHGESNVPPGEWSPAFKHEAGVVTVVDPATRKMQVPMSALTPTRAVHRKGIPSLCLLFIAGRCRQGSQCHQVHCDASTVDMLRAANAATPTCCVGHGDVNAGQMQAAWLDRMLVVHGVCVPLRSVGFTKGIERIMTEHAAQVHGGRAATEPIVVDIGLVCRLHGTNSCRYSEDCKFLHPCQQIIASQLAAWMPQEAPPAQSPIGSFHTSAGSFHVPQQQQQAIPQQFFMPQFQPQFPQQQQQQQFYQLPPQPVYFPQQQLTQQLPLMHHQVGGGGYLVAGMPIQPYGLMGHQQVGGGGYAIEGITSHGLMGQSMLGSNSFHSMSMSTPSTLQQSALQQQQPVYYVMPMPPMSVIHFPQPDDAFQTSHTQVTLANPMNSFLGVGDGGFGGGQGADKHAPAPAPKGYLPLDLSWSNISNEGSSIPHLKQMQQQ